MLSSGGEGLSLFHRNKEQQISDLCIFLEDYNKGKVDMQRKKFPVYIMTDWYLHYSFTCI